MAIKPQHLAIGAAAAAALLVAAAATKAVGPVKLQNPLTELEAPVQDFAEHLAHGSELLYQPVTLPHRYPDQTCPGTTRTMHQGFTPLYKIPDPQIAALPAEEPW